MAKLKAYYGLCPLVDHKNFIGISRDAEHGHVIVTQGKNIAIKYKLSDQKQIQSWRTKDKFTSPVIFDNVENKYIAVFNRTTLRLWGQDDTENLDKIKKHKFKDPIYTITTINSKVYVIFENGNILTLKDALEQRKNLTIIDIIGTKSSKIIDMKHIFVENIVYICLLVKTKTSLDCLLTSFPDNFPQSKYHKIEMTRDNSNLIGHSFCVMYNKYLYLLSLWSDGQLYSYLIAGPVDQENERNYTEPFGSLYTIIEFVSCKQNVAMIPIVSDHIAIYGADCNQEGASIIIYNTQFKLSQSKQPFKMFSNITKIWNIDNVLLLCSGQHLAVIPFEINMEQLSQLVGSHKVDVDDADIQHVYTIEKWDVDEENDYTLAIPVKIRENVVKYLGQGLSKMTTCDILIPTYITDSDLQAIENCLDYFRYISERCLLKILVYLIENHLSYNSEHIVNRNNLIDKVLSLPFTNTLLLPHIKANLSINTTLNTLKYISLLFISEDCLPGLDDVQTEGKLIEWGCILIDGNYQRFLLTRDDMVRDTLKEFYALIQERLLGLKDMQSVEPVLKDFVKRKCVSAKRGNSNVNYSVEQIKLY